jgi:hypothetical protein
MPLCRNILVLSAIALFSLTQSAEVFGAELYGWIHGCYHGPAPYYIGNPKNMDIARTVPGAGAIQSYPAQQGETGLHAYPYGYFGAQTRPYSVSHRNYYNDFSQWSFRRGY